MSRSLIMGIVATLLLISGLAAVFYYFYIKEKEKPLFDGIPNDAALVIETTDLHQCLSEITASPMWQDLGSNEQIHLLTSQTLKLDSILQTDPVFGEIIQTGRIALSFHPRTAISLLLVAQTGENDRWVEALSATAAKLQYRITKRVFEKNVVFELTDYRHKPICSISWRDNLLLCSPDPLLIEDALIKLRYKVMNPVRRLDQLITLARNGSDFNLYINHNRLPSLLNLYLKQNYSGSFDFLKRFANWSLLNIKLDDMQVELGGVTITDDSLYQYLDLFGSQTPVVSTVDGMLPENTAANIQLGFSDYGKFKIELVEYLQQMQVYQSYENFRDSIERIYDINLKSDFENLIGDQVILGTLGNSGGDFVRSQFAVIKPSQPAYASNLLKQYTEKCDRKLLSDSAEHTSQKFNRLPFGNFLKCYFGKMFESISSPYYTMVNDVIILANDAAVLYQIQTEIASGRTLAMNADYQAFRKKTGASFNFSIGLQTSAALRFTSGYVTETLYSQLNRYASDFRKFQFVHMQFARSTDNAFYTQLNLKYNPAIQEVTRLAWESKLDTLAEGTPQMVFNPNLNQQSVWVQDKNLNLYVFTREGSLLWRTRLSSRLLGQVQPVDFDKNGAFEYFFNTETAAFLVDQNGIAVFGYPVKFPGKTTMAVNLTDVYGDSNYRWFATLSNNRITGYDLQGRSVKGWNPKLLPAVPVNPAGTIVLGQTGYVYTTLANGELNLFNLQGSFISHEIPKTIPGRFHWIASNDTASATIYFIDSAGWIQQYQINSAMVVSPIGQMGPVSTSSFPVYYSPENNYYLVYSDSIGFGMNDPAGKRLFSHPRNDTLPAKVFPAFSSTGKLMIGRLNQTEEKVYLYDSQGNLHPDFPLEGYTQFTTGHLFGDGVNYLVTGDSKNYLRTYRLK